MHPILSQELARNGGLIVVRELPAGVPRWALSNAARSGRLERVHPGVYRDPSQEIDPLKATATYLGDRGALSHTTALAVWGLTRVTDPLHATVARGVRMRPSVKLAVHTRAREDLKIVRRRGLPVTPVEDSLVDSWPLMPEPERTGCVLDAVGQLPAPGLRARVRTRAAQTAARGVGRRRGLRGGSRGGRSRGRPSRAA